MAPPLIHFWSVPIFRFRPHPSDLLSRSSYRTRHCSRSVSSIVLSLAHQLLLFFVVRNLLLPTKECTSWLVSLPQVQTRSLPQMLLVLYSLGLAQPSLLAPFPFWDLFSFLVDSQVSMVTCCWHHQPLKPVPLSPFLQASFIIAKWRIYQNKGQISIKMIPPKIVIFFAWQTPF